MSLADRLEQARKGRTPTSSQPSGSMSPRSSHPGTARWTRSPTSSSAVHAALVESLGRQLYQPQLTEATQPAGTRPAPRRPGPRPDPAAGGRPRRLAQQIADDILGYGPLGPTRDPESPRSWSTATTRLHRALRQIEPRRRLHRRRPPASHHRHDRRPCRPARRRVLADGRRPAAGRLPRQRRHPPARRRWPGPDHPQVRRRPLDGRGPHPLRHHHPGGRRFLDACVRGKANILVSGGTGSGKTTLLNVLSSFIPEGSGSSRSRTPPSSSCSRST